MTTPTVTAWAIKAPDGQIVYLSMSKYDAIDLACGCRPFFLNGPAAYWEKRKEEGWRCVPVYITEAMPE